MPGPDIWGPHGWKFIHYITLGYPNNPSKYDKEKYYNFFMSLAEVIPCNICANHFKENLKITPLDDESLKNKESLMIWGINMHNHVNKKNGKKIFPIKEAIKAIIESDDTHLKLEDSTELNKYSRPKNTEYYKNKEQKEGFSSSSIILSVSICINILLILIILLKLC
jgi:hypothetical protein